MPLYYPAKTLRDFLSSLPALSDGVGLEPTTQGKYRKWDSNPHTLRAPAFETGVSTVPPFRPGHHRVPALDLLRMLFPHTYSPCGIRTRDIQLERLAD